MKCFLMMCCLSMMIYNIANAQQSTQITDNATFRSAYGVYGNINANIHTADFRGLPNVPSCCPAYGSGFGIGYSAGLLYQMPLSSTLRLALRGGFNTSGGTLRRNENVTLSGNESGVIEHSVRASIMNVGVEPLIQYSLTPSLWLSAGGFWGTRLQSIFSQKELITQPATGTFNGGLRSRNEVNDAAIPSALSMSFGLLAGVGYDLPLNNKSTMILAPELLLSLPLTGITRDVSWNVIQIRGGIALKWSPTSKPEPIYIHEEERKTDTIMVTVPIAQKFLKIGVEQRSTHTQERGSGLSDTIITTTTIARIDTTFLPIQKTKLSAQLRVAGILSDGTETQTVRLTVEEFASARITAPLLGYIFFDENTSDIPNRYVQLTPDEVEKFSERTLSSNSRLTTYYSVLNIIGTRMKSIPDATLTLTGCNSGVGVEKGNIILSRSRAESVKRYLVSAWGIAEQRIQTEGRNLPDKSASGFTDNAQQENRRVEITANKGDILLPLVHNDTLRVVNPPVVRFAMNLKHDTAISDWKISVTQGHRPLRVFSGKGKPPADYTWSIDNDDMAKPITYEPMECKLTVNDVSGTSTEVLAVVPVEQITIRQKKQRSIAEVDINKYSIVLFDIRSAEISSENKRLINVIKNNIQPNSKVTVTGYTDLLGDAKANQTLAEERAITTAATLGLTNKTAKISGIGSAELYDSTLPEGRLYCRTVDVVVETPVTKNGRP
jgi:outer membrane protein OmpA-like peptidoglycan-associated protein